MIFIYMCPKCNRTDEVIIPKGANFKIMCGNCNVQMEKQEKDKVVITKNEA